MGTHYTYILASKRRGALYVGMTDDLIDSVEAHKAERAGRFTREYRIRDLVYYETHVNEINARACEARWKTWHRSHKLALIEAHNPDWRDLYPGLAGREPDEVEFTLDSEMAI